MPEVSEEDLSLEFSDYVIKLKDSDQISQVPQSMANKTASQLTEDGGAVDIQLLVENDSKTDKENEESKNESYISPTNDDSVQNNSLSD